MKKFLSIFAAVAFASAMVCGFTACKSNSDDDEEEGSNKTELVGDWKLSNSDDDDDEGDSKKSNKSEIVEKKQDKDVAKSGKTDIVGNWDIVKMCLEDNCVEVAGSFNFESNGTFEISIPQSGYYADGEWSLKGNTLIANSNGGIIEEIEIVRISSNKINLKGEMGGYSYTYTLVKNE